MFISFKVAYSKFSYSRHWEELTLNAAFRFLAQSKLREEKPQSMLLMRSPYDRTISCFMDKFRSHPLYHQPSDGDWQHCQKLVFRFCGCRSGDSHQIIAERLLSFPFERFLEALPTLYAKDGHFRPQTWSRHICIGRIRLLSWPDVRVVHLENAAELRKIPDVNWSKHVNVTREMERDFEFSDAHRRVIERLYRKDFELGAYSFQPCGGFG